MRLRFRARRISSENTRKLLRRTSDLGKAEREGLVPGVWVNYLVTKYTQGTRSHSLDSEDIAGYCKIVGRIDHGKVIQLKSVKCG